MQASLPPDEKERLKALYRYEILDTSPEAEFDDIALLASHICGTPIAIVSLVDENRQWFKSKVGTTASETPRDIAFCAHGILQGELFIVNDAQLDARFASNPLVTGDAGIRFYAGVPLITPDGHALGMLCVSDRVPRDLSSEQKTSLQALSRQVVALLELRRSGMELRQTVAQLKRAQEALDWKAAFLEAQVNSSLDGILVVDERGKKILQNKRTSDLLRIPQHIVDGEEGEKQLLWVMGTVKNPAQFIEKVSYIRSNLDEISRDEIEFEDGRVLDRYSAPVVGKDGKYYGRIWTFRDITERGRAERLVRQSAERYRSLFDNARDAIFTISADGTFTSLNAAVEPLGKISRADWIGRPFAPMVHPDDLPLAMEMFKRTLEGEQTPVHELRGNPSLNEPAVMEMTLVAQTDESGKIIGILGIGRDITERKKTEQALHRLRDQHESILRSVAEGVHGLGLDGRIIFENPASAAMLGHEISDLIGRPAHGTMHHSRPDGTPYPQNQCPIYATLKDGVVRHVTDEVFWRKDNTSFPVEYTSAPLSDEHGGIIGVTVVFSDVTARRRLEAQVFQSQKMETVGKLAGGIAHEFNSILTAILGQSELLLGDLPPRSPLAKNAMEINQAASRAAMLTRQLLAYGRKQILQPETLDLNRVIAGMEGVFRLLMGGDVDTRVVPASDLRAVEADAGQIEQVIMNIVINARDAMPNGGKLTLETANVTFDEESVTRYPELKAGDYVMLAITDTGPGLSGEVKARLFEPFFSTKAVGQGTGLGLSTCYGIVKQSGGHISAYSEVGRGATFKIYLPQGGVQARVPRDRLAAPGLPPGTETILLVEDDPALREMASTLLRRLGYTVWAAANGVEALSLKQQSNVGHIDLLFTDVVMPHMSGKELADRVRVLNPHTRILFTSAYTENAIVHQGVLDKGVALLQKPFTPSALANKLREVLDQPGVPRPETGQDAFGFAK